MKPALNHVSSLRHKLPHHARVLVFKDVTMIHVRSVRVGIVGEFEKQAYALVRRHDNRVLQAHLTRWWGLNRMRNFNRFILGI